MTFLREDGHRPTQDELQLMHVHLDNVKQPSFVDCYAPVYETLQYSPSIAFQTNLQSHANTKNSFFPNISKDTQQSILTKNQRAQAINDVQSQMIASKIPLCLVQDIYGRLHQLVYMIPQNLYDQFSNNVQVGKKVTLRSHYETLQSKQKSDNELNPSKNKESDLSPLKLTKQQQQQQQQIVLQTHVQKYNALQLQEAQKQQQLLLQQQNQQKQQEALLQQHQKQQQLQSQKQQELQQLHQQQQLQQQVQHQHQLQHELQHKLQQQLQQHLLFLLQPQALATPPLSPPSQQLDQQELQMQQQKLQNHQNQDQQQLLHSPPPQQHMQHQLQQQLVLQENWTKDKTIVSTCDMTKNEKPVFASADSSTEFQYTLNVKPSTDNYEEIPRDMFLENSNKNSSKPQTVSLSEYLELDSNTQLNEASSLSLHSVKKAKTNDPTPMCESSSINIISSRKRKSSETSDYEEDLKKSNLTSKENNFEKLFMEESITLINNDTMSEENQESIWTSFWDEISSTSNDSEIFISEELSYINNNRLLDSSYIHTKDDCKSNNNDFVEEYNKRDFLQCEPLDQFDLFQHILM